MQKPRTDEQSVLRVKRYLGENALLLATKIGHGKTHLHALFEPLYRRFWAILPVGVG